MEIEHVHNREIRYTLSNENLQIGDKVYPIASGRCRDNGTWVIHELNYKDWLTGMVDEPHTIIKFDKNEYRKFREIVTDRGYSPEPCYYKIIKEEIQVTENRDMFPRHKWVELTEPAAGYTHKEYMWDIDKGKWVKRGEK